MALVRPLYDLLFDAFRFLDCHGSKWDAFDECIHDVAETGIIRITRFAGLRSHLPREAELLSRCLEGFVPSHEPKITVQTS